MEPFKLNPSGAASPPNLSTNLGDRLSSTDAIARTRIKELSERERLIRTPPNQFLSNRFPQLHYARIPEVDLATYRLRIEKEDSHSGMLLSYDAITNSTPPIHRTNIDFHCVTGWSVLNMDFMGLPLPYFFPNTNLSHYKRIMTYCLDDFVGSLPIKHIMDAWLVWEMYGVPLEPKHGFPFRLVVPSLYGFKSAKWIHRIALSKEDELGFWEIRGYDDSADPWAEERFAGKTGRDGLTAAQRAKTNLKEFKP